MNSKKILSFIIVPFLFCSGANAQVRITEFMASNSSTLVDEDGDSSDWIEIQNTSATNVSLLNWSLTDKASKPTKWRFPAENIAPQSFMIVFASDKDRAIPGAPLHTNFKLSGDGDYLALVRPDGSIATEISPEYPAQFPDVSYGIGMKVVFTTLVSSNASLHFRIPSDASEDSDWTRLDFSDAPWQSGFNGIGYDSGNSDPLETSFAASVLQTSPTAYWRLNETNGTDAANIGSDGSGAAGGYLGNLVLGQPGPRPPQEAEMELNNLAPLFNGTDSYVNGPYQLLSDLTAFTIGGWIRPTAAQQSHAGLFGQNDVVEFGFNTASTIQVWTPLGAATFSYPYPKNEWHYVTAVGDSTNEIALYLDGNKVANQTVSGATFGNSEYFFNIGGGGIFGPNGNWFSGQLDEVAVWQRALSASEIAGLISTNSGQVSYAPFLNTDVQSQMYRSNATAYVRIPFTVSNPASVIGLKLLLRYDDGFVAYINGHEIFQTNAPDSLAWNSTATSRNPDANAAQWQEFDVSDARNRLQPGNNVLAIQGLNISADNTDFLIQAQLIAENLSGAETPWRYLTDPTPGGPNGINAADYGPSLSGAGHFPDMPQAGDFLTVTANVAQAFSPISNVTLKYRVMFGGEISVPMNDSGTNGDISANDGTWTGIVPANVATAGQMIRYYVTATDSDGNISRWPIFKNTEKSQQYLGTVAADPSVQSLLPVAYLFIQNPAAADTQNGTQASLFYLNELYDNINISIHGQSSTAWIKKSHNIDFPKDHEFLYKPGGERQSDVIFMSDYGDKARMRTTLTYEIAADAGGVSFFSFPIRIHLNGAFWGIEDMVEHGDETFLSRVGRDPNGALYKMYNALTSASGNEKKTREWEDSSDLSSLIMNLDESRPLSDRVAYGYDNLDLPQTANYFATMALVSSQDLGHKNYYLYHDNDGTGEWAIFPWDVDLTWGRNWTDSQGYFTDKIYTNNVLSLYNSAQQNKTANRLFDLFFGSPDFRQMYLRRLRTLMDTILMPPGAPTNSLVIEPIIRRYENNLNPPGISSSDAALDYATWGPTWADTSLSQFPNDAERIISIYLPGRRAFLFNNPDATLNGNSIPAAQPTNAALAIASWDFNPISGNLAEQFVELQNTNSYAVDISGWRLGGDIGFTFRPGTVVPASKSIYVARDVNAFRSRTNGPSAGDSLYVQGSFTGFLSTQGNSPVTLKNNFGREVSANSFAVAQQTNHAFTPGNLAVLRIGNGTQTLNKRGNSIFIDEYTTNGTFVGSAAIPDDRTNALVISGSASSEGALTLSAEAQSLVFAGYNISLSNAAALASSLANSSSAEVPRGVGIVNHSGEYSLAATTTNQYSANNIRSAAGDGFNNFWGAGGNSGTLYFGNNAAPFVVQNASMNTRVVQIIDGDLYFSTGSGSETGIRRIPGAPTNLLAIADVILDEGGDGSPYAFAFSPDFTIAYVSDDRLDGNGGVQRWDFGANAWTLSYAFAGLTNTGARGLAVDFSGAKPIFYATTAEDESNRLVAIIDTGTGSAVKTLATAGEDEAFRGVTFTPNPGIAPQFTGVSATANEIKIAWRALFDRNYTIQYTDNLPSTNWIALTNITATMPIMNVTDSLTTERTNRFYRVMLNP